MTFLLVTTIPWTAEGELGPWGFHTTNRASAVTSHSFLKPCQTFILSCLLIKGLIYLPVYFSVSHFFRCGAALLSQKLTDNFVLSSQV